MAIADVFKTFPTIIIDKEYILREQTLDDVGDFFRYFSDPEVSKYILSSIPKTMEEAHEEILYWIKLFKNRESIYWAVADRTTNRMIGAIGFNDWNRYNNRTEISYDLSRQYWKKNIMSRAIEKVVEFGFKEIGFNRIQASTVKSNVASMSLLKKAQFKHEGTLQEYRFHNGRYYDVEMFSQINPYK
jgi:ribosomal-protein-alanine N-acetyltransferase